MILTDTKFDAFGECLDHFSKEELAYIINYALTIMDDHVKAFPGRKSRVVGEIRVATLETIVGINRSHMMDYNEEKGQNKSIIIEDIYNKYMS